MPFEYIYKPILLVLNDMSPCSTLMLETFIEAFSKLINSLVQLSNISYLVDINSDDWLIIVDLLLNPEKYLIIPPKHPGYLTTGAFMVEIFIIISTLFFFILAMICKKEWKNPVFADSLFISSIYINCLSFIFLLNELNWCKNMIIPFYPTTNFFNCTSFVYIKIFMLITIICYQLICLNYFKVEKTIVFEYMFFIQIFLVTMFLLVTSTNLFYCFLLIETQSLILYILVALKRYSNFSVEASVKYFIFGSYASGLILIGISLIYYFTGTLNFFELNTIFSGLIINSNNYIFIWYAIGMVLIGIFLKIALAPFHFWIADIYEGSPTIVTSFLAIVSKLPLLILLLKLVYFVFIQFYYEITIILMLLGLLSIVVGSTGALYQPNFKKMIAYSTIAHTGYMIIALAIGTQMSLMTFYIYIFIYTINSISIFAVIVNIRHLSTRNNKNYYPEFLKKIVSISILKDYSYILVFIISITIFSLAGLPPFSGFFSKFLIFWSLIDSSNKFMSFLTIIISIFSMVYYVRLVRFIFFHFQKDIKMPIKNRKPLARTAALILIFIFILNLFFILFFPLLLSYSYFMSIEFFNLFL